MEFWSLFWLLLNKNIMSLIVATVVGAILFLIRAICLVALLVISGNEGDLHAAGQGMSNLIF